MKIFLFCRKEEKIRQAEFNLFSYSIVIQMEHQNTVSCRDRTGDLVRVKHT